MGIRYEGPDIWNTALPNAVQAIYPVRWDEFIPVPVHICRFPVVASLRSLFKGSTLVLDQGSRYELTRGDYRFSISQATRGCIEQEILRFPKRIGEAPTFMRAGFDRKACEILFGLLVLAQNDGLQTPSGICTGGLEFCYQDILGLFEYPRHDVRGYHSDLMVDYHQSYLNLTAINVGFSFSSRKSEFVFEAPYLTQLAGGGSRRSRRTVQINYPVSASKEIGYQGFIQVPKGFLLQMRDMTPRQLAFGLYILQQVNFNGPHWSISKERIAEYLMLDDSNSTRRKRKVKELYDCMRDYRLLFGYEEDRPYKNKEGTYDVLHIDPSLARVDRRKRHSKREGSCSTGVKVNKRHATRGGLVKPVRIVH